MILAITETALKGATFTGLAFAAIAGIAALTPGVLVAGAVLGLAWKGLK